MKLYSTGQGIMLAACDEDLLGKTFREGKLNLEVVEEFYKGDLVSKDTFITSLRSSSIANLAGTETIDAAVECGMLERSGSITIQGVPHAQICRM